MTVSVPLIVAYLFFHSGAGPFGLAFIFAGMSLDAVQMLEALHLDYERVEDTYSRPEFQENLRSYAWSGVDGEGDALIVCGPEQAVVFSKVASFLLREDISCEDFGPWFDNVYPLKDEKGRVAYGASVFMYREHFCACKYDYAYNLLTHSLKPNPPEHLGGSWTLAPYAYLKLGRFSKAIEEAALFKKKGPYALCGHAMVDIAAGRALCKLGRLGEAESTFWNAIATCKLCHLHNTM